MDLFFAPLACSMSARIALTEAGAAVNLVEVDTHAGRVLATGADYRADQPARLRAGAAARRWNGADRERRHPPVHR